MASIGTIEATLSADETPFVSAIDKARTSLSALGAGAAGAAVAIGGITAAATAVGADASQAFADFEASVVDAGAKAQATKSELAEMSDAAMRAGQQSLFSSAKAADAMGFLAQAGLSVNEQMDALPGALELATAGNLKLAKAADIATDTMSGLGLEVDQLGRVNDVLVKTANSANTSVEQLGQGMAEAAPLAASANMSLEQVAGVLGQLASAGIKGSQGGVAVRSALAQLSDPAGKAADALNRVGISVSDVQSILANEGLTGILARIEKRAADTGKTMTQIFGQEAGPKLQSLLNQGTGATRRLQRSLQNAGGTAESVTADKIQTLSGQLRIMRGSVDTARVAMGEQLKPTAMSLAGAVTDMANKFTSSESAMAAVRGTANAIVPAFQGIVDVTGGMIGELGEAAQWMADLTGGDGFQGMASTARQASGAIDEFAGSLQKTRKMSDSSLTKIGQLAQEYRKLKEEIEEGNQGIVERIQLNAKLEHKEDVMEMHKKRNEIKAQKKELQGLSSALDDLQQKNKAVQEGPSPEEQAKMESAALAKAGTGDPSEMTAEERKRLKRVGQISDEQGKQVKQLSKLRDKWGSTEKVQQRIEKLRESIRNKSKTVKELEEDLNVEVKTKADKQKEAADEQKRQYKYAKKTKELSQQQKHKKFLTAFDDTGGTARERKQMRHRLGEQGIMQPTLGQQMVTPGPSRSTPDQAGKTTSMMAAGGGAPSATVEDEGDLASARDSALQKAKRMTGQVGELGSALAKAAGAGQQATQGINAVAGAAQSVLGGLASSNPLGMISGAIGGITSLLSMAGGRDSGGTTEAASSRRSQRDFADLLAEKIADEQERRELFRQEINIAGRSPGRAGSSFERGRRRRARGEEIEALEGVGREG